MSNRSLIMIARNDIALVQNCLRRHEDVVSSNAAAMRLRRASAYLVAAIAEIDSALTHAVDPILDLTCGATQ